MDQPLNAATDYSTDCSYVPGTPRCFTGTLLYGSNTTIEKRTPLAPRQPCAVGCRDLPALAKAFGKAVHSSKHTWALRRLLKIHLVHVVYLRGTRAKQFSSQTDLGFEATRAGRKKITNFGERELCQRFPGAYSDLPSYLGQVGGLASLVLGDLMHRVLGALLGLAVGPPPFRDVYRPPVFAPYRSHPTKRRITGRQGKAGKAKHNGIISA